MEYEPWVAPAVERLDSIVEEGIFALGAQLWVSHRGRVVCDVARGRGVAGAMTPETVHNHYCVGKPFVAAAIGALASDGLLDLHAPLDSYGLPAWAVPPFASSVLDVLDHQVGLDGMSGVEYRLPPTELRPPVVAERIARARRRPAFSEVLGGLILEEVISAVAPDPTPARAVARLVLEPLGLGSVAFDPDGAARLRDAGLMSVPFGGLPNRSVPLLSELLHGVDELRPAFGVVCATRDFGRFFEACRRALDPDQPDTFISSAVLAELVTPRHAPFDDRHADRVTHMAGGFMVDAVTNGLSRLASHNSFGHNAGFAQTVGFADIDNELTVALYLNGGELGSPQSRLDRLAAIDELYRCMALR